MMTNYQLTCETGKWASLSVRKVDQRSYAPGIPGMEYHYHRKHKHMDNQALSMLLFLENKLPENTTLMKICSFYLVTARVNIVLKLQLYNTCSVHYSMNI